MAFDLRHAGSYAALVLLASAPGLRLRAAAPEGKVFVCDSTDDRILLLQDLDGSGRIEVEAPGEISVFYDDTSPGPDLSIPSHLASGRGGEVYVLDGGTLDAIFRLEDLNRDEDALDAGELTVFYDNTGSVEISTPNTVLWDGESFWVADDGSRSRRIVRLRDLNKDRDALDEGEATVAYEAAAADAPLADPESLVVTAEGILYAGDTASGTIYRLQDLDRNGDFMGSGEMLPFFASGGEFTLTDIDSLAAGERGELYAADEDSGLVLVLEDTDRDGTAAGPGEVWPFVDATAAQPVSDLNDMVLLRSGCLLLVDGREDTIWVAEDLNGDGDALEEGEIWRFLLDAGESLATPSGIAVPEAGIDPGGYVFLRGDVIPEGRLNLSDAVATLEFLFRGGVEPPCLDVLDANDSGDLNLTDGVYTLRFLFSGGPPPPPPYPEPGVDPTPDDLECPRAP